MSYHQLTSDDRYMISVYRKQGLSCRQIAYRLGRDPGTISREVRRNCISWHNSYRAEEAQMKCNARRRRSRRNRRFSNQRFLIVVQLLRRKWSPEQIAAILKLLGVLSISYETIYQYSGPTKPVVVISISTYGVP